MKDREIHGESSVSSTAERQEKINRSDDQTGLEQNHRSVDYGKQCSLA